ncbi:hypothetical protein CLV94_0228 [Flavobacterium endophyticum]|uniref:Uncharacterized protein n=1 Tax=Flavobacterium endophyticum TaxID=1540163 RepID=A0A495MIE1_9FLAO|nr:hypothetical protein [Flavobacterium endophyticum]RKS25198.1 hypothetical protein CLV94_0228 [Flavobacterium endophyticum]
MKNILFLLLLTCISCSQKEQRKEELASVSTIIINLSHAKYPKQITINSKKGVAEVKNLNSVVAASADVKNHPSDSQTVPLDETSLTEILNLFNAIDRAPQQRTLHGNGMLSSIEAHTNDGKTINLDQLDDRHEDEIAFIEAVLRTITAKSKDPKVQTEMTVLLEAL